MARALYPGMMSAVITFGVGMGSSPALAGGLATGTSPPVPWLRIAFALLFCVALAATAILALRHYQGRVSGRFLPPRWPALKALNSVPHRAITVIETRRLGQHGDVCLLHCAGHAYLLAMGPAHMLLLDRQVLKPESARPEDSQ